MSFSIASKSSSASSSSSSSSKLCGTVLQEEYSPACVRAWVGRQDSRLLCVRDKSDSQRIKKTRVPELCESQGGCPGLSVLMSLTVSVDVKQH